MKLQKIGCKVDGTGSGLCPRGDFGISSVESLCLLPVH
jgi:hypothetical protein